MDDAEVRRIRADPESESENRGCRQPGTLAQRAARVTHISEEIVEPFHWSLIAFPLHSASSTNEMASHRRFNPLPSSSISALSYAIVQRIGQISQEALSRESVPGQRSPLCSEPRALASGVFTPVLTTVSPNSLRRRLRIQRYVEVFPISINQQFNLLFRVLRLIPLYRR